MVEAKISGLRSSVLIFQFTEVNGRGITNLEFTNATGGGVTIETELSLHQFITGIVTYYGDARFLKGCLHHSGLM